METQFWCIVVWKRCRKSQHQVPKSTSEIESRVERIAQPHGSNTLAMTTPTWTIQTWSSVISLETNLLHFHLNPSPDLNFRPNRSTLTRFLLARTNWHECPYRRGLEKSTNQRNLRKWKNNHFAMWNWLGFRAHLDWLSSIRHAYDINEMNGRTILPVSQSREQSMRENRSGRHELSFSRRILVGFQRSIVSDSHLSRTLENADLYRPPKCRSKFLGNS